jgi:hypothetical protein
MENRFFGNTARGYDQTRKNRGLALDDVYVVSPSFLVNFRYGLTHQEWTEKRLSNGLDLGSLGFSSNLVGLAEKPSALPYVTVSPFDSLGNWASGDGVGTGTSHSFTLNLTKLHGNHNLRFGADFRIYRQNRNQNPTAITPTLSFNSTYTRGPLDSSAAPSIGGEITSFLLGIPAGSMDRVASSAEQDKFFALYVQDDFKLSSRVNLNFGLRYEYETPVTERFDRSVAHFAFDQSSPIEAAARANYAAGTQIPELPLNQFYLKGGLTYVNTGGNPRSYWESEKRNFMPRIGISFQVDPKTILRGGYGIFFDTVGVNNTSSIQTGYSQSTPIQASLDSGLTFIASTANPFPNGLIAPLGSSGGLSTNLGQSISFFPARRRHPYSQRWSLGLQRALPGQFVVEASYVGNRATRINVNHDINALPGNYLSTSGTRDTQTINYLSQSFPNPLYGTNSIYGTNTSRSGILRPYPQFGSVTVLEPVGYSWYHALQVRAEKRLSHGYTMQLSYTWSKTMDATEFLNSSDPVPYRSISAMDRTHRIVFSGIWEVPVGRGRSYGGNMPKVANFFAGGWQLNMVMQRQSGPPLAFGDVWTLFTGDPTKVALPKDQRSVDRWFNTDAGFNRNSSQQLSSNIRVSPLRFGGIRGDGQARWDFSAIKTFGITEKLNMQFRAECLNAWNHPNLFTPNTTPTSSTFGMITGQDVPRIWQMSLKLAF